MGTTLVIVCAPFLTHIAVFAGEQPSVQADPLDVGAGDDPSAPPGRGHPGVHGGGESRALSQVLHYQDGPADKSGLEAGPESIDHGQDILTYT